MYDKGDEKSVNIKNGILSIYDCGKKSVNRRAHVHSIWKKIQYIRNIISQWTSNPELYRFIHKYIQCFGDVIKCHLDLNNIYLNYMNIANMISHME